MSGVNGGHNDHIGLDGITHFIKVGETGHIKFVFLFESFHLTGVDVKHRHHFVDTFVNFIPQHA